MSESLTHDPLLHWVSLQTGQSVQRNTLADILGINRHTYRARVTKGLSADDVIAVANYYALNPVRVLVDLGYITRQSVDDYNAE